MNNSLLNNSLEQDDNTMPYAPFNMPTDLSFDFIINNILFYDMPSLFMNEPFELPLPNPKVFSCPQCNRSFARKYDLIRHIRVHTGVKPYACPSCKKRFSRSDARTRHIRTEPNCQL